MAYSDQDILGKIGDLLVEINEHYAGLDKNNLASKKADILLLAAQANQLASIHLSHYKHLEWIVVNHFL